MGVDLLPVRLEEHDACGVQYVITGNDTPHVGTKGRELSAAHLITVQG
jgi:hypothetical protein